MASGRKGFYEELNIKKYLSELTPKMFAYVMEVMNGEDNKAKERMVERILPKIVEKGMPTQITGEEGGAIIIQVASEIKDKNSNETSRKPISNS